MKTRFSFARVIFASVLLLGSASVAAAVDNDMDGYDTPFDCNDSNPSINPGAVEITGDSVDQNCDFHEKCWPDEDDDGARLFLTTVESTDPDCTDPREGVSSDPIDCDDTNAAVNPTASEVCDEGNTDEDCDGVADDDDTSATGETSWYTDGDGDGYGTGSAMLACEAPVGTADEDGDCDDGDASVHPGSPEHCDEGNQDEDCDGLADDSDPEATGKSLWYADVDDDGFGDASTAVTVCDPPVGSIAESGDCDDTDAAVHPAATEVCDAGNKDEDCDGVADNADTSATGKSTWYFDVDDDGYGDASTGVSQCDPPAGTVSSSGDCDDAKTAVHPGAAEVCDDATDNDCDDLEDCNDSACGGAPACGVTVQVFDHLECFKIKAGDKMKGTVNVDPGTHPKIDPASGCTVLKASKYCVPVAKTVTLFEGTTTQDASHVGQELTDDRICYKMKCPAAEVGTVSAHDQFGTHDFEKFKVSEICTPAIVVP
jgi:hypothetical protein